MASITPGKKTNGLDRNATSGDRMRRNFQRIATGGAASLLPLAPAGGIYNPASGLSVKLPALSGLSLTANGLQVGVDGSTILVNGSGNLQAAGGGVLTTLLPLPDDSGITAPTISTPYYPPALTGTAYPSPGGGAPFRYAKAAIGAAANPGYVQRANNSVGGEVSAFEVSFMFDGVVCEIQLGLSATQELVYLVNGVQVGAVQAAGTYAGSTTWSQTLTFTGRGPKLVTVRGANSFTFGGVTTQLATDTVWMPGVPRPSRAIVLGDSFTEPTMMDATTALNLHWNGWADWAGRLLGWDVWPSGQGGTGYTTALNSPVTGRSNYPTRFAAQVTAYDPDVVVVASCLNDLANYISNPSLFPAALAAMTPLIQATIARLVVIVGPFRTVADPSTDTNLNAMAALLSNWVAANTTPALPWLYVEPQNWVEGTGNQGSTTGVGNSDFYIGTDAVHPSAAGHEYLGRRFAASVLNQLV